MGDLIHDHGIWTRHNRSVAAAAKRTGKKRVVSPRGMLEPWAIRHRIWKKRAAWWAYQRKDLTCASALHATSMQEAKQLRRLGLKLPIIVLPNLIEVPEGLDRSSRSKREKTAVFLGRIHPKKGLLELVSAWQRVNPEGWKFRIIGPDEDGHLDELKSAVADAGLSNSWTFLPPIYDSKRWQELIDAQLMILPTHSENFGQVVAESLAVGTPVLTTTGTPWSDLPTKGCGWYVKPTPDGLAVALKEAMQSSEEELGKMGDRGSDYIKSKFSRHAVGIQMMQAYFFCLDNSLPPPECLIFD
ncbi:MAG: glycosyltransferase [Aureliella sp.]